MKGSVRWGGGRDGVGTEIEEKRDEGERIVHEADV